VRVTTWGSGGGVISRWRPAGIFGDEFPDAATILQLFSKKNTHFKHILSQISAKNVFQKCLNKTCF